MAYSSSVSTRSLYIHWPFCPYRCHFCPFVALAGQDQFMTQYHKALTQELIAFGAHTATKAEIDTIFIGGGTPSTYPPDLLLDMFGTLKSIGIIQPTTEITLEVNPGTVTDEKIAAWSAAGINRLSIGVQSLKDSVLKNLNRHQSAQDVYKVLHQVQGTFTNVSVDLILGLPGVSEDEWKELINTVVSWPIKHLSMYFLTVHEQTPLYFRVQQGDVALACDDSLVDLYYWSRDKLIANGFNHYEISSFARDGYECRHNSVYWERKPYKGFGLGAHSFDGATRFQNEKNLMKYMAAANAATDATVFAETLSREQAHRERVMLGLRRARGIAMSDVLHELSADEQRSVQERIAALMDEGWLYKEKEWLRLTPKGLSVEHHIAVRLSR